jgi:hypothetical protein
VALVDLAVREYGRIDVQFNNAAMAYFNWPKLVGWPKERRMRQ